MTADLLRTIQRVLSAWDTTTLKTNGDGMLSDEVASLRTEFDRAIQSPAEGDAALRDRLADQMQAKADNDQRRGALQPVSYYVRSALGHFSASKPQPKGAAVPQGPRTEFVLNELRSALNGMLTFFGMDEDENSKAVFDKARQAYNYAEIVMRPLEPWERQSLEDFRAAVHRWHEKACANGYDGVESMCDAALPYGTRDLRLVAQAPAPAPEVGENGIDPLTEPGRSIVRWRSATPGWAAQAAWLDLSRVVVGMQMDAARFRWLIDDKNSDETNDTPMVCTSEDVHWGDKARSLIDLHMKKDTP